jgi:hypothetical protein
MKNRYTKTIITLAAIIGLNVVPMAAYAASGSMSLVANRASVGVGGSLIVAIYMNGGGNAVNAVEADLNYPSSKLQYVGFSASGTAFEITATNGSSDGVVNIARGTTSTVSGSGLVGTVTFRGLAGSGSASISFAGSSSLVADGNAVPFNPSGVSVTLGGAAAAASAPAAAPVVEAPKDTTPPTISEIKAKDLAPNSATISWKTNEDSDSVVEYGLDTTYGLSASSGTQTSSHTVVLGSTFLTPKTVFHFRVKSTDGSGNVQTSPDQTMPIPGIPVTVVVRAADGQPQAGAMVTLDNQTGITDDHGSVTIPSGAGNKTIITSFNGVTLQRAITVTKDAKKPPSYQLALSRAPENRWMYSSAALAVTVLILLGIDSVLFGSRFFAKVFGIRMHMPALPELPVRHHGRIEPLAPETPQVSEATSTPTATAPAPAEPRYTTIRPMDLSGDLDLRAAADVPLSQLVNNVPRPVIIQDEPVAVEAPEPEVSAAIPAITKIEISHFTEPAVAPAAHKKVTRKAKKPATKKKTTLKV